MYCYLSKVSVIAKAHLSLLFIVQKTFTGLLTNYFSFTPFKYKLGLIKTLIDRAYKINNTTQGFHNGIKNLSEILKRNMFPKWLIDKSVKGYLLYCHTQKTKTLVGRFLQRYWHQNCVFFFQNQEFFQFQRSYSRCIKIPGCISIYLCGM